MIRTFQFSYVLIIICLLSLACENCAARNSADAASDQDGEVDSNSEEVATFDMPDELDVAGDPTSDASIWNWTELPPGEECGAGCRQLSFSEDVRVGEWDVWEQVLAYVDGDRRIYVVDISLNQHVTLPPLDPEYASVDPPYHDHAYSPSVFNNGVYYGWATFISDPPYLKLIHADVTTSTLESL